MDAEQKIGRLALEMAEHAAERLLVYAEVEDEVISADLFYTTSVSEGVRFRFASTALREEIYSFWDAWRKDGKPEWRTMAYVMVGGKFSIDFLYEDQMKADEELHDRRPKVVREHFGDMKVDYSRP